MTFAEACILFRIFMKLCWSFETTTVQSHCKYAKQFATIRNGIEHLVELENLLQKLVLVAKSGVDTAENVTMQVLKRVPFTSHG